MRRTPATIGLRVKSGWASAVLLAGPASAPRVLDCCTVELADPAVPATRQPYHAGFGTAQQDAATIRRLRALVARCARRAVAQLVRRYRAMGFRLSRAGVVAGSDIDPARIANPHIRAHAEEGRLFRTVVSDAAQRCGLEARNFVERELPAGLKRRVARLERPPGSRWRTEEKAAALAAWIVLRSHPGRGAPRA